MAEALSHVDIAEPARADRGQHHGPRGKLRHAHPRRLVDQVTGRVRWRESIAWMAANGVTEIWEIGAGKALSGMIRRIDRALETRAIGTPTTSPRPPRR
jgi:[acyl-carrier-protein] S-malonyltransferase